MVFFFTILTSWSQESYLDSLKPNNYEELKGYIKSSKGSLKEKYIKFYLKKAKIEQNTIEIAEAYKYKSLLTYPDSLSIKYADSIIFLTKNIKNIKYPALGYNIKGGIFFELGDYKKALDQYLIAVNYAKLNNNNFQYLTLKFNIGLLKNNLGERVEAQKIFKKYLDYIGGINGKHPKSYIRGLYAIADSYVYSNELDTADIYIDAGVKYSLKRKDSLQYAYFVLTSGVNNFFKKKFNNAIDSLKKTKKLLSLSDFEQTRMAICNYYIGKSFYKLDKENKGVIHFKKVDSLMHLNHDITPELIDVYNYLIEDAKKNKDLKAQVKYINSLIKFDSILDTNYKYIKNRLVKSYYIPELFLEKEQIIKQLNKKNSVSNNVIWVMMIAILILIALTFFVIRRNYVNKKRFEAIINIKPSKLNKDDSINIANTDSTITTGLPEELEKEILMALEKFETSNNFVKKTYTLNILAKELNTNSSYLSKVINVTKKINFSSYLNNLRVNFAIDKLSNDKQFRAYTIKAIAEDSGFNNAQSFSVAFHKNTGLYPSYFIKKLNSD